MKKYILTIGKNDKDEHKQLYSDNAINNAIISIITKYVNGATLYECDALYKGEIEKSIRVEIISEESIYFNILKITDLIKTRLNQESVMVEIQESNIMFAWGDRMKQYKITYINTENGYKYTTTTTIKHEALFEYVRAFNPKNCEVKIFKNDKDITEKVNKMLEKLWGDYHEQNN